MRHARRRARDLVDIGGESTRPGAERVDAATEADRVLPVIRELAAAGVPMSIDTTRARVAEAALAAGAAVVNDVSGGLADPDMARVVADARLPVGADALAGALPRDARAGHLHRRGRRGPGRAGASGSTRRSPPGSAADRIVVDPGLGFAKTAEHNWRLSARLPELLALGYPVLFGASRKSYLGALLAAPDGTPRPTAEREAATVATSVLAVAAGAWGVRVHDVRATVDALAVWAATGSPRLAGAHHDRQRARRTRPPAEVHDDDGPDPADRPAGARPARGVRLRARAGPGLRGRRRARAGPRARPPPATTSTDTVHYGELAERLVAVVDRRAGQPDRDPRGPARSRSAWPTPGSARPRSPCTSRRRRSRTSFTDVAVTMTRAAGPVTRAVLSLGSNLGDRLAHLRAAVAALGDAVLVVSGVYETPPWGDADQPRVPQRGAAGRRTTSATPRDWLDRARDAGGARPAGSVTRSGGSGRAPWTWT